MLHEDSEPNHLGITIIARNMPEATEPSLGIVKGDPDQREPIE